MMRGEKSQKLADKDSKKPPPVAAGQRSRGSVGTIDKPGNGGSQVSGKKRKTKKDKQLPQSSSLADGGKDLIAAVKKPLKAPTTSKTTSQSCSGKCWKKNMLAYWKPLLFLSFNTLIY